MRKACCSLLLVCALPGWAEVVIEDAWVRAVPPVSKTSAAYFRLRNTGPQSRFLTGATAEIARAAEMHDMAAGKDGLRSMKRLERIEVAADAEVVFAPGGKHLMLFGLEAVPPPGEQVDICLSFERGEPLCASFEVRREALHDKP